MALAPTRFQQQTSNTLSPTRKTVGLTGEASPSSYNPGFQLGKNFKTIGQEAWGVNGFITPEYISRMATARPELFAGIDDPSSLVTANMVEGESSQQQMGWNLDPKLQELLSGMSLQRTGAGGLKDGRTNALFDSQGGLVYADTPYSYDPAKETLQSAVEAAALAAGAFGGVGMLGHGPLAGFMGGGGAGAGAAADAGAGLGHGAFLGEGVASGVPGWDAAFLNAGGSFGGAGAGAGALSNSSGSTSGAWNGTDFGGAPPIGGGGGGSGGSFVDTLKKAGGNLLDKAVADPLKTLGLVGGLGAVIGGKPSGGGVNFDPTQAAQDQYNANKDASLFDAILNRPDQVTPWGSSTWKLREGADPKNPQPGDWINTVALDSAQQQILDQNNQLSLGYGNTASDMLSRVQDAYAQPFNPSGIPGMPDFASINTDTDRQRIEEALLARLEPQLQRDEERARTRLLNTGFEYGSQGTEFELDRLNRAKNDARLSAVIGAGTEARGLADTQRANMLAQLQGRQQGFSEESYKRGLPLNELNAFRAGSQVQAPQFQNVIPTNTAAAPELDALLAQLGIKRGNAANDQAGYNALLQALAGLGSAWIGG